jgi:hypothetical protein
MTDEDVEHFIFSVVAVIFRMCKSVRMLYLLLVKGHKPLLNPFANPDVMSGHWLMAVTSSLVKLALISDETEEFAEILLLAVVLYWVLQSFILLK